MWTRDKNARPPKPGEAARSNRLAPPISGVRSRPVAHRAEGA